MAVTTNATEKIPDKVVEELANLFERTGLGITEENGQRRLGRLRESNEIAPPKGTEVFVGKLPRDCYEPELVKVFETMGEIYELRLMMDFGGTNRGFCFVQYYSSANAQRAVRELNNYEIRKGRFIGVVKSVDNCRLFVGGLPTDKSEQDILEEIKKVTEGVVRVIMYPSAADKTKNRGFSFVEYTSHKAAAMARRKMMPGKILMFGVEVAVDWAEPEPDVDSEIMGKVPVLYVRNLMLTTTEELLQELFNAHSSDGVEKVKKLKDFAFVHFNTRAQAETAKDALNDTDIDGSRVEITWAKPVDKNIYKAQKALSRQLYPSGGRSGRGNSKSPMSQSSYGSGGQSQGAGGYGGGYSAGAYGSAGLHMQGGSGGQGLMHLPSSFQNGHGQMLSSHMHGAYMHFPGNYDAGLINAQRLLAARFNRGRGAAGVQGIRLPHGTQQALIQHPSQGSGRNMFPYAYGPPAMYPEQYYYAYHPAHHTQFQSSAPALGQGQGQGQSQLVGGIAKKTPQDLLELCSRNNWSEPIYSQNCIEADGHSLYYICTITIHRQAALGTKEYRGEHYCQDAGEARALAADGMYRSLQNEINAANQVVASAAAAAAAAAAAQKFHYAASFAV